MQRLIDYHQREILFHPRLRCVKRLKQVIVAQNCPKLRFTLSFIFNDIYKYIEVSVHCIVSFLES